MKTNLIQALFLALFFIGGFTHAQVASPHNFPHASGVTQGVVNQNPGYWSTAKLTMGMDGIVAIALQDGSPIFQTTILDSIMRPRLSITSSPFAGSPLIAIAKDHKIWCGYNGGGDAHIAVFTRTGTVLNQFKIQGSTATGLLADTSGHIFITYNISSTAGFGVMRFSSSFVPDYDKWVNYTSNSGGASWRIDQRLYVGCGSSTVVLDADGNPLKVIQNLPSKYAVFQDHGIATVQVSNSFDSLYVVRRDSSMNVLWSKRFKPGFIINASYFINLVDLISMPGSGDLQIIETSVGNIPWLCSGSMTTDEVHQYLFGPQGQLLGESRILAERHMGAGETPFGDMMTVQGWPFCILPATAYRTDFKLWAGFDIRSTCTGSVPSTATANYVPSSPPTIGSNPTTSPTSMTLVAEPVTLTVGNLAGGGAYACHKPCVTLTGAQAVGAGQVAFQDDAVGFYDITYDFGDGTFGHTPDPIHAYPSGLPYTVSVTASNACGSTTVASNAINPCILPVIGSPASACVGASNLYRETSGLPNDSLQWLVNGVSAGIADTLLWNPSAAGTYQIGLIYHDGVCHDTTIVNTTAFAGVPVPSFTFALGSYLTLNFTNTSTNAQSYLWDFGDGTTSTQTNPSHTYATNGTYTICLTGINACGSVQSCQTWSCPFPTAAFTANPNGATVGITDQSTGATSMTWDFGDGQTATGTVSSHTYSSTGTYTICQTVTNNCATVNTCRTVNVVATSNSFYRIDFAALGVSTPKGVASNAAGNNLTVGSSTPGAFMQMTDAQGGVLWTKTYPSANYAFNDVAALPNGNFLVVGGSTVGSLGGMDASWFEVDGSGAIVTRKAVGTTSGETWTSVNPDRTGGFLLGSYASNLAGRIDAGLNLLWSHSLSAVGAINGFQVADNSFWFVGLRGVQQTTIRFLHFSSSGAPLEEYDFLYGTGGGFLGFSGNKFEAEIGCDGTIYFVAATDEYLSSVGTVEKVGLIKFNTTTHTGTATTSRITGTSGGSAPYFDAYPQSMVIKPNGTLQVLGYINRYNDINTSPKREKMIMDVNPSTLAFTANAYGTTTAQDMYLVVCPLASGSYLAAGTVDDVLQMHKFNATSQCQVGSSSLSLFQFLESSNSTPVFNSTFSYGSSPFGTANTPGSPVGTPLAGNESVACATPCGAPAVASFTYTVSGNSVTFTSTSTPGANLVWTIPGQSCLTSSSFTLGGFCGTTNVTLTASNGCGGSSVTQTITTSNTVSGILGPDQTRCPGNVTLSPGNGYATYAWSTGATTSSITTSTAGTYMVTVTTTSGCSGADTMNLAYYPPVGSVSIGTNQLHCPGVPVTFTATAGFSSYLWSNGATTQSISTSTNGTYSVTATNANGCTATASATLSNYSGPTTVSAGANQTRCPGASATFSATTGFITYLWSNGANTRVITVTAPGTYTVTATTSAGCQFTSSVTLFNYTVPALSIGPNQTVCPGASATFTASSGFTSYAWSNGATTSSITVTTPGTYTVTATTSNGCTSTASASLINGSPTVSIGPNQTICGTGSATFTATSGFTSYAWSTGATTSSITVSTAGTYSVTVTDGVGCTATTSATLSVFPAASVSIGPNQTVCPGTNATFTATSGFASYLWSNGATTSSITVNTAGTYSVTATDANGCTATASATLSNFTTASVSIGPNQTVCTGANATFTATSGFTSYLWSNGATTSSITVSTVGTYSVTATDANGCTATASATLSNFSAPSVSIGPNQTVCTGANATYTATSGFTSYLWSNGATTSSITVNTVGTYSVTATDANGCTATASATLSNFSAPSVSIGPNQTVCPGANATFTATSGFASYLWSNGATTSSITVSTVGTYSVTATDANGCTATASATLSNFSAPSVSIGPNQTVCPGANATFTATSGFTSYLWSNGATTSSITVNTVGTYSVTATDANGCTATASATLSNFSAPSVSIGPNQTVCPGANATFTATSGFASYLWSNGATTSSITVSTVGMYSVTATDANGCTATASATLSNFSAPSVSIGPNQTVCPGANATFTATSGFTSYLWSNGATTSSITVSTVGTYSVTSTNSNGCTATASATLSNFSAPSVSIGPNQTVCPGGNATFTATSGFTSYLWSNGATTSSITVSTVGTYSVTATDANGCTATSSASLSHFPSANFSLGPDTSFCPDTTWQLSGPNGGTYLWSTSATSQSIAVGAAGTYSLQYTDANGCTANDAINLTLSADCVWPGDANHDGIADNQDLLAVGFGFGYTGPTRPNASPSWYGQPAPNWSTALPNLVNHKHPDCDGDGTIAYTDTILIATNYGYTHSKGTGVTAGIPLFIEPELDSFPAGDTVFFRVVFGDANNLVVNGHGVAFSFHIDPQQVTGGTLYGRYLQSFLGNGTVGLLTLTHPETGTGNWHIGLSRKDQIGHSGAGAIMRVGFLPDQVYPLTSTLGYVPVRLFNPMGVDGDFNPLLLSASDDSIFIYNPVNALTQPRGLTNWNLYPVPTAGTAILEIQLSSTVTAEATLVDMHGRVLRKLCDGNSLVVGSNRVPVETQDLAEGMYFVKLTVDGQSRMKKLVVER